MQCRACGSALAYYQSKTDNHKLPQKLTTTENSLRSNIKYFNQKNEFLNTF